MENITVNSKIKTACNYVVSSPYEAVKLREPTKIDEKEPTIEKLQTITEYFNEKCELYKQRAALAYQYDDEENLNEWTFITYKEYNENVKHTSLLLLQLGVQQHSTVAILASNCPEWLYVELAAINIGAIVVGIYPSSSAEAVYHMLSITETVVCVVDTLDQWFKIKDIKFRLPKLKHVVQLNKPFDIDELKAQTDNIYYNWCDLKALQITEETESELLVRQRSIFVNECALYVFTSGSIGLPKAVMISHYNILYNTKYFVEKMFNSSKHENQVKHISYLPLCHVAAQVFDMFFALEVGSCLYIANSQAISGTILQYLPIVKPTVFVGVPRIYEKLQLKALEFINNLNGISFYLMDKARRCVTDYHLPQMERKLYSSTKYWCAKNYIGKLKAFLGLDNCRYLYVCSAPLSSDIKRFFLSLDLPLNDCYGLSECSGVVVANTNYTNFNALGQVIKGFELKIQPSDQQQTCGEFLIRGPSIFMGYLNDLENSMQAIDSDGWFHTGDCGYFDDRGNVVLNGRIKEIIITSGGENIPVVRIEMLIKQELPCLSNVVIIGDHRKYLTALFTFKTEMDSESTLPTDNLQDETKTWLNSIGLYYEKISDLWQLSESSDTMKRKSYEIIIHELEIGLARVNEKALSRTHKVQYFTVLPHDFSTGTGEQGSILKIKRHVIMDKYSAIVDEMYREGFQNKFANVQH